MRGVSAATGAGLSGVEHLAQSVTDILATRIGTRVMRRDYGSEVPALLDRPLNHESIVEVFAAVAKALDKWEPRLRLRRVRILAAGPGRVALAVEGEDLTDEGKPITLDGIILT